MNVVLGLIVILSVAISASRISSHHIDIPATAGEISYKGRVLPDKSGGGVSFDWSGIEISTTFTGTGISAVFTDATKSAYSTYIDGKFIRIINTTRTQGTEYELSKTLSNGPHNVTLVKRTEAEFGISSFGGFKTVPPQKLSPTKGVTINKRARSVEFLGDSITCGFGDLGQAPCPYTPPTEDVERAYGPLVARHFGAQIHIECLSGICLVQKTGDPAPPLPVFYPRTLAGNTIALWNFSQYIPDAVVINLGTNDYGSPPVPSSSDFIDGYHSFINYIWGKYGRSTALFLACGPMIGNPCCTYVQQVVNSYNGKGVYYVDLRNLLSYPQDYGCDGHPGVSGHEKMANATITVMSKYLDW